MSLASSAVLQCYCLSFVESTVRCLAMFQFLFLMVLIWCKFMLFFGFAAVLPCYFIVVAVFSVAYYVCICSTKQFLFLLHRICDCYFIAIFVWLLLLYVVAGVTGTVIGWSAYTVYVTCILFSGMRIKSRRVMTLSYTCPACLRVKDPNIASQLHDLFLLYRALTCTTSLKTVLAYNYRIIYAIRILLLLYLFVSWINKILQ